MHPSAKPLDPFGTTRTPHHRSVSFTAEQPGPGPAALLQIAALAEGNGNSNDNHVNRSGNGSGCGGGSGSVVVFLFHLAHMTALPPTVHALVCHAGVLKVSN